MPRKALKSVAIVGAGPVGLAAAAHALERGLEPVVLEAGPEVGHAVRAWGHVRMFSPWEYNLDRASERLLEASGWNSPDPTHYPTGNELIDRYIQPLAERTPVRKHIKLSSRVTAVARAGFDKKKTTGREQALFEIQYRNGTGLSSLLTDAVIDTSGTWSTPAPAGANGLEAAGEYDRRDRITYGMPDVLGRDRDRYAGKTVAVLGSGHSAIGTLIDLTQLKERAPATRVLWLLRGDDVGKAFGGGSNDKLAARGELGARFAELVRQERMRVETGFRVSHVSGVEDRLRIDAERSCSGRHVVADELIVATGFRPEMSFLRELRIALDPALECPPALAPLIDPNEHSCGTVRPHGAAELAHPEAGFYIAGMKSYGRAPTFLMLTGYEQVRSIVADIAGDHEAARRLELKLPETGVCSGPEQAASEGCCEGPPSSDLSACCARDEIAKLSGETGCGCAGNTIGAEPDGPSRAACCT